MMTSELEVYEVKSRKDLREFVSFPFSLYKDCPHWIPPLIREEIALFDSNKNPAFEFCKLRQWIVKKNGKTAGRIAGIVHRFEMESTKTGRFGWIEFIDDHAVSKLLLSQVENWFKEMDIRHIHGPFGFSDLDPEGMLIEGFDSPATIATIYNYSYYPTHVEKHGYKKSADWIEWIRSVKPPPNRLLRAAKVVEKRCKVKSKRFKNRKEMAVYGQEMFSVLNESFRNLYGFHTLSPRQIDFYIEKFLGFVDPEFISIIINDKNEIVAFAIAMPSLSEAFRKAKGRLFPLGVFNILRGLKNREEVDLLLIGVRPDYQRTGIVALIFRDLTSAFSRHGFKKARSSAILEKNYGALTLFDEYAEDVEMRKRRRCFKKSLS